MIRSESGPFQPGSVTLCIDADGSYGRLAIYANPSSMHFKDLKESNKEFDCPALQIRIENDRIRIQIRLSTRKTDPDPTLKKDWTRIRQPRITGPGLINVHSLLLVAKYLPNKKCFTFG